MVRWLDSQAVTTQPTPQKRASHAPKNNTSPSQRQDTNDQQPSSPSPLTMATQISSPKPSGLNLSDIDFINNKLRQPPAKKSRLESYFLGVMEFAEAPPSPSQSEASFSGFDSFRHEVDHKSNRGPPSPASSNSPSHIFFLGRRSGKTKSPPSMSLTNYRSIIKFKYRSISRST
jgi:hypothetical protein